MTGRMQPDTGASRWRDQRHRSALDRIVFATAAGVGVLALAATAWILGSALLEQRTPTGAGLIAVDKTLGGPLALVDHSGRAVTEDAFRGRLTVITFGYTACPDICPTTLQTLTEARRELGAASQAVNLVFVTLDPGRDTQAVLATYVAAFDADLVGLRGTAAQIAAAARAFDVIYAVRTDIDPVDYPVDHSALSYLMDRDWRLLAAFRHDATADEVAATLRRYL